MPWRAEMRLQAASPARDVGRWNPQGAALHRPLMARSAHLGRAQYPRPCGPVGISKLSEVIPVKLPSGLLALISGAAIVASACSSGPATAAPSAGPGGTCTAAADATQIEAVSWWTTGPESDGFNALVNKFNCDNPRYWVSNSAIAGGTGAAAQAALQNRIMDGRPPDTFQIHMGHELLDTYVVPGFMANLDDLYAADSWTTQFPQGLLDIVGARDAAGTVHYFSVPLDIHRANVLWYNKTVFAANNLKAPTTWDEFISVADALKAKDITPLAIGDSDVSASGMILEDVLLAQLGAAKFNGLWTGATDWSNADVTNALNTYKKILSYANTDHSSLKWDQAADYLIPAGTGAQPSPDVQSSLGAQASAVAQPKAAMTIMGDWVTREFDSKGFTDYGYVAAPGGTGIFQALADSFGLPAKAPQTEGVKKFLSFIGSAPGQDIFNPYTGSIPANLQGGNPPAESKQYSTYQKWSIEEWKNDIVVPSLEFGAAAAPSWKGAIENALKPFAANPDVASLQTALAQACKDARVCR
jgi:glucose/mannose transport system substrate-binding protein